MTYEFDVDDVPYAMLVADEVRGPARKTYECSSCEGTIERGDRYQRILWKFEGELLAPERYCEGCAGWPE